MVQLLYTKLEGTATKHKTGYTKKIRKYNGYAQNLEDIHEIMRLSFSFHTPPQTDVAYISLLTRNKRLDLIIVLAKIFASCIFEATRGKVIIHS